MAHIVTDGIRFVPTYDLMRDSMSSLSYFLYGGQYTNQASEYEFWKCRTYIGQITDPKNILISLLVQLQSSKDVSNICNDIIENYNARNFCSYSNGISVDETFLNPNYYKQIPSLKNHNISDSQRKMLFVVGLLSSDLPLHHHAYQILGALLGSKTMCYRSSSMNRTFSLTPKHYLFSRCGKFSFRSIKSVEWYKRKIPIMMPYVTIAVNDIKTSINTRLNRIKEKQEAMVKSKQLEKERRKLRIFLQNMCDINWNQVDDILKSLPSGSNCNTIYDSTPEFLRQYMETSCAEKISDALAGKQTETGECPLCYLNMVGLPICIIHDDPLDQKREWRLLDDHKHKKKEKCSICLVNKKNSIISPCNHDFCRSCILSWFDIVSSCPLCRQKIVSIESKN